MQKYLPNQKVENKFRKEAKTYKKPYDQSISRFWGDAARLEHTNTRNKSKSKKR